jgi:hypothetical protein
VRWIARSTAEVGPASLEHTPHSGRHGDHQSYDQPILVIRAGPDESYEASRALNDIAEQGFSCGLRTARAGRSPREVTVTPWRGEKNLITKHEQRPAGSEQLSPSTMQTFNQALQPNRGRSGSL